MLTPTRGISLDSLAASTNPPSFGRTNLNGSNTSSFAQQLAESLESYLKQSGGSHVEIDILPQQGGDSGTRQFVVTVKDPAPVAVTSPMASPQPTPPAKMDMSGMMMFSGIPKDTAPAPIENPITNEVDAYWATQPEEVQILRTIDDPEERGEMGLKLASQGFAIDPAIMIHRWDPYMTMRDRKAEGYTWVPSVGQNGIPVSPGLSFPNLPSYDPSNPPPGSVLVSTDFAIGLERTSPGGWSELRSNPLGS